jgi:hypothetical protein
MKYLYEIFQCDQNVRNLQTLLPSARFGPNCIFFYDTLTRFTNKSMQHIIMLFSRSEIQHRNARIDLALPKTTAKSRLHSIFRIPAGPGVRVACRRRAAPRLGYGNSVAGHFHESV